MDVDTAHTRPTIRRHSYRDGVRIVDPIEDTQFSLYTSDPVDPRPCDTDRFYFPVTTAATIETDELATPVPTPVWVRDAEGSVVAEVNDRGTERVPEGLYSIEFSTNRIKLQLAVQGPFNVTYTDDSTTFTWRRADRIHVGARSFHEQPAATVTTTEDPADIMTAISTFGSALKTTSPEQSFPTLRGHPPTVERGSSLTIPDSIRQPGTDVEIEVPQSFEYIFPVAPLAYYLGATLRRGPTPRLVTDDWEHQLNATGEFETTVERTLKQIFLLDCVTRTEGYYQVDLREREVVEEAVNLDFAALYDQPISERLESYLDVCYDSIAQAMPKWKLTADVRPEAEYVSALPFLANELAVIRCPSRNVPSGPGIKQSSEPVDSFYREGSDLLMRGSGTRADRSTTNSLDQKKIVRPQPADSIEQTYVGEGIPVGASKMTIDAYYRRLDFQPSTEPRIDVTVVCNDEEMTDENVVSDIYGSGDWIDFDIQFKERLTTDELRNVLRSDSDFLHYIGHVDEEGIRCIDGYLDAKHLKTVNVSAFFLNACASYDQGRALVEHGAMGGIATKTDIINEAATSVGRTVAKLLNEGFSLAATVTIIEEYEQIGHHYLAIGDSSAYVLENESGTPHTISVEKIEDDLFDVSLFGYPNLSNQMGTIFTPELEGESRFALNSGLIWRDKLSQEVSLELIHKQEIPTDIDGDLQWSSNINEL